MPSDPKGERPARQASEQLRALCATTTADKSDPYRVGFILEAPSRTDVRTVNSNGTRSYDGQKTVHTHDWHTVLLLPVLAQP